MKKRMGKKTKATIYTMIVSTMNFLVVTIFNLIYSSFLIQTYGSAVNGLISTLTQFVSLFAIIEGGFTTAAIVSTYEPIAAKNYKKLNDILYTARQTYRKYAVYITLCVLILGSFYIRIINSPFSYQKTFALLIVTAVSTASSLCFLSQYSVIMQGNNQEYVFVLFSLISKTVTWIASMILIIQAKNIILVYSMNAVNVLLNSIICKLYEKKAYPYITYRGTQNEGLIKGTGDVLFQKIASTIFTSTDLVIISVCINLASASVYNLYYQIYKAILNLLSSMAQAPFNSFGQLAHSEEGREKINKTFEVYQEIILLSATILLTTTGCLIIPFVRLYTLNIKDYEYINTGLAILFYCQIFTQIINRPYGTILNATGNFKMQNKQCACAAIINIFASLAFIKWLGICSIVLGSFIGTLIILAMNIYQAYKHVLRRKVYVVLKNIIVNFCLGLLIILGTYKLNIMPSSYLLWILEAMVVFGITLILVTIINIVFCRTEIKETFYYFKNKLKSKK